MYLLINLIAQGIPSTQTFVLVQLSWCSKVQPNYFSFNSREKKENIIFLLLVFKQKRPQLFFSHKLFLKEINICKSKRSAPTANC